MMKSNSPILTALLLLLCSSLALPCLAHDPQSELQPIFTSRPSSVDLYEACGMLQTMILTFVIKADGGVRNLKILQGTGCDFADSQISRCIRAWCYEVPPEDCFQELERSIVINWGYPNSSAGPDSRISQYCRHAEQLWALEIGEGEMCAPIFRRALEEGLLPPIQQVDSK